MNPCEKCKKYPNCPEKCKPKEDYIRQVKRKKRIERMKPRGVTMFNVKRLKMLMLEKGLSQKELARKIGVTEVSMSRYCRESRCPKSDTVSKMAVVLGTTTDYLMGGYAPDTPEGSSGRVIELIRDNKWRWTVGQYKAVYRELTGEELY